VVAVGSGVEVVDGFTELDAERVLVLVEAAAAVVVGTFGSFSTATQYDRPCSMPSASQFAALGFCA
jgi:hypothetical protein